jgi:D-beta-D-heptose 7-phosphate kinase/D-beta-D-heptose 1-phosphate adenosyltransferase
MTAQLPVWDEHLRRLTSAVAELGPALRVADSWGTRLASVLAGGGRLLAAGNGGSAAQAQHLTAELVGRYHRDRPPFSGICLSAETSTLTAIGNDYPAEELFARQVQAHGRPGDVLVLLSTSGGSRNVVEAARRGRAGGLTVWAMTGPCPNAVARLADETLAVEAPETATVQELHLVALHVLCGAFDRALGVDAPSVDAMETTADGTARHRIPVGSLVRTEPVGMSAPLVVVGDTLLDIDTTGTPTRLAPDAPVPVLEDAVEAARPGGAGLAAVMAAREGQEVVLVTALADDGPGRRLRALLAGVPGLTVLTLPHAGRTVVKHRIRAGDRPVVRLDTGDDVAVLGTVDDDVVDDAVRVALAHASAVLVSDYGRGVTARAGVRAALEASARTVPLVWDPHPRGAPPVAGARLVTPNAAEAALFAARDGESDPRVGLAAARRDADRLVRAWQVAAVAVTMGPHGALVSSGDGTPVAVPAPAVVATDTCGAGDRFAVAAAVALLSGAVTTEAVQAGVVAASDYVAAGGPASLSREPVRSTEPVTVEQVVERVRASGGVLVATGGCFDLLHAGHVATLRAARRLGDALVVCVNSDASVRRLKGPDRPLVAAADRCEVLAAVEGVDAVVVFDEDTPHEVLRRLRPDVWAKGGDYAGADLPEAAVLQEWGGQAVALPYLPGRSTSHLVLAARGPEQNPTHGGMR